MNKRFLQSEIRQKVIDGLRTDLIGPRKGKEEVLDENPELSYLTGILHPVDKTSVIEFDDQADIALESAESDSMGEEDNEDKYATKFKQQSSLGVSFYIHKNTSEINVSVCWGDYVMSKEEYEDKKGEKRTRKVYVRFPRSETLPVKLDFQKNKEFALTGAGEGVRVKVSRYALKNDYQLVSVYVSNHKRADSENASGIMFQVELEVGLPNGTHFVPEYKCRVKPLADEYLYESRPIFAHGHGVAVDWDTDKNGNAVKVFSQFIPEHEIPSVSAALTGFPPNTFSMQFMMNKNNKEEIVKRLISLHDAYADWIKSLSADAKMQTPQFKAQGEEILGKCTTQADRILNGISLIEKDNTVFKAFCFMNQCMFMQRSITSFSKSYGAGVKCNLGEFLKDDHSEWRAFQIAFILLNLSSIVNQDDKFRKYVDLLYFPTGGGKTEAYLGLMAFLMGYRRLTASDETDYNKDGGVTIILRYTLRLLTTQQRDRLTKMIVAAEIVRQQYLAQGAPYGKEPFSIGFYVGGGVTPNKFDEFSDTAEEPEKCKKTIGKLARQLINCPYCGKELKKEDFNVNLDSESVNIYCSDANCFFHKYKQGARSAIPVYLVDEQIYRKCPTVIIATVDKFARLPWDPSCNALFGRVDRLCPRHGYIAIGKKHEDKHREKDDLPATVTEQIRPFFPPELVVQDELHLITGPLGTIYGGYEAAIEELCSITKNGAKILPKYIVSTATIKNAEAQVKSLYGRKDMLQFPANGIDIQDSFFTKEVQIDVSPFRKYCGICASGKSVKTTTLRIYALLLQNTLELAEDPRYADYIDPYHTLIGYFNSIRELGGTVRLLQDDIPKRIRWIKKHYDHKNIRYPKHKEITSRMTSDRIAGLLKELESPKGEKDCLDVAIATNMISVGLDIDRLGLMCVMGQPKQNAEYIQTTSRIGRSHPGLVVTIYNPYRPRDLSHYENFKAFHSHIYRFVEGTTATPFSARARDRVLHALFISLARLQIEQLSENAFANNIDTAPSVAIDEIMKKIAIRVAKVAPKLQQDVMTELTQFIDDWKTLKRVSPLPLHYYCQDVSKGERLLNFYGEHCRPKEKPTLNSMREVENTATVYYYEEGM